MKGVIGLTAFIAIATLGISYLLLPQMGILGAGIAWLVSQSIIALMIVAGWVKGRQAAMRLRAP
ncbi:MAG: hypothetical protein DDT40_00659 [candidate division WS2 bacterium]|nr:hypothetical protein [Candidatus Psychracetigena formicireducens]